MLCNMNWSRQNGWIWSLSALLLDLCYPNLTYALREDITMVLPDLNPFSTSNQWYRTLWGKHAPDLQEWRTKSPHAHQLRGADRVHPKSKKKVQKPPNERTTDAKHTASISAQLNRWATRWTQAGRTHKHVTRKTRQQRCCGNIWLVRLTTSIWPHLLCN